jgi:hypothetical protein
MRDGDYRVTCDKSGFVCWRSECAIQWDGMLVRKDLMEQRRHPQDLLIMPKEIPFQGVTRKEQADPPNGPIITIDQMI